MEAPTRVSTSGRLPLPAKPPRYLQHNFDRSRRQKKSFNKKGEEQEEVCLETVILGLRVLFVFVVQQNLRLLIS